MSAAPPGSGPWEGLIRRYRPYLPVTDATPVVTLHEGNTPLLPAPRLSERVGAQVFLKIEGANPTGSFKDRGMTVAMSKAAESGASAVVCASTGNTSASAAAYAARAGLDCFVLIPEGHIALGKLAQALVHGARVLQVRGNFDVALEIVRDVPGRYPVVLVNSVNPHRIEGQKTAAFEIVDALGDAPDVHCIPVGNAGNITAYWKGYLEYQRLGLSTKVPKMLGFQAAGAAPIVEGHPIESPETIATAIRIGNPASWFGATAAASESGGSISAVTDEEILEAYRFLAERESVFCEAASAAAVAGLLKVGAPADSTVVCILTGHGLKDPDLAISQVRVPDTVDATFDSVARALGLQARAVSLERVEVLSRVAHCPGHELIRARASFCLDPAVVANETIADLELAAGADGLVRFAADLLVLEPQGPGPAPLLYVVANRGRAEVLPLSFPADAPAGPLSVEDPFLLALGWRIVWCGWQCDLDDGFDLLRLDAPLALEGGATPPGFREIRIEPEREMQSARLTDTRNARPAMTAYPTIDLEDERATLYARPRAGGELRALTRSSWRFARALDGRLEPSPTDLALDGGFSPEMLYVLSYRPAACPVNGVGLAAARDVVAGLRYDTARHLGEGSAPVSRALAFGVSQSGRYLRQLLAQGLNVDEEGRGVFDGVLAHIAGARVGDFNLRYGQLSVNRSEGPGLVPPYAATHPDGGLLDRQRALGHLPKVMLTNSGFEYWRRDCSAIHAEPDGSADLPEDPDVRCYLVAGTSHVLGEPTPALLGPLNPTSVLDPLPVLRALFLALDAWVASGEAPPPSCVPRVAAGELCTRAEALAALRAIPGCSLPEESMIPVTSRSHPGAEEWRDGGVVAPGDRVVALVAALDADGNECAGVRLPELVAPLYTHLGINPRAEPGPGPLGILDLIGSSLPLPATTHDRERRGDPRPAVEERYGGREDYLERVAAAAEALVARRLLLEGDLAVVLARAGRHFDAVAAVSR